jgi:ATP-dependent Clp protease ATP-binding subunit ClpC
LLNVQLTQMSCRDVMRVLARSQLQASTALHHPEDTHSHFGTQSRRAPPALVLHGPRGCGKATLCSAVASAVFPHPTAVLWLNMSHYAGPDGAARLLGPPPGMVGHREGGALTQQLRRRRRFLLVLEDLPRAHPVAMDVFLNIVRDGAIDAGAATLDCRHVTVLATAEGALQTSGATAK